MNFREELKLAIFRNFFKFLFHLSTVACKANQYSYDPICILICVLCAWLSM